MFEWFRRKTLSEARFSQYTTCIQHCARLYSAYSKRNNSKYHHLRQHFFFFNILIYTRFILFVCFSLCLLIFPSIILVRKPWRLSFYLGVDLMTSHWWFLVKFYWVIRMSILVILDYVLDRTNICDTNPDFNAKGVTLWFELRI